MEFNAWQHQRVDPPWWPLLSEYLERHPQKAGEIGSKDPTGVEDPGLRRLFSDETVQYVFEGRGISESLDEIAIRALSNLRTSESDLSTVL